MLLQILRKFIIVQIPTFSLVMIKHYSNLKKLRFLSILREHVLLEGVGIQLNSIKNLRLDPRVIS
jgi:hypothetical protein